VSRIFCRVFETPMVRAASSRVPMNCAIIRCFACQLHQSSAVIGSISSNSQSIRGDPKFIRG
jgi:hypothetical protein